VKSWKVQEFEAAVAQLQGSSPNSRNNRSKLKRLRQAYRKDPYQSLLGKSACVHLQWLFQNNLYFKKLKKKLAKRLSTQ